MEPVFVAIHEAAEALGIGRTMTYQLIKEGDLATAKIGRRSLVTAESVRAYAARVSSKEPAGKEETSEGGGAAA
ncbi:helix-turn-helix domain-containing protein [Pseudarthrobacter sp. LMD1-1-1.1]|uniref:helix-turn-helix domain-containing protein n=1 Tax=Pseudarthrobacter sp. LMD1-1-1.1 TaxID=3135242 RepID=UPI0034178A5F